MSWLRRLLPVHETMQYSGVHGLRTGVSGLALNTAVYAWRIGDTVIDTACSQRTHSFKQWLADTSSNPTLADTPLTQAIVSHHHEDHSGNAHILANEHGLPVYAPAPALPMLRGMWHPASTNQKWPLCSTPVPPSSSFPRACTTDGFQIEWYRKLIWGTAPPFEAVAAPSEIPIQHVTPDGHRERLTAVIVPAPGHCEDHSLVYIPEKKWLFGADILVATKPKLMFKGEDAAQQIETLHAILHDKALDFEVLFCSHRGPIAGGRAALESKLRYLLDRQRAAAQLRANDIDFKLTEREIARKVVGYPSILTLISAGDFAPAHMTRTLLRNYQPFVQRQRDIGAIAPKDALAYLTRIAPVGSAGQLTGRMADPRLLERAQLRIRPELEQLSVGQALPATASLGASAARSGVGASHWRATAKHAALPAPSLPSTTPSLPASQESSRAAWMRRLQPAAPVAHLTELDARATAEGMLCNDPLFPQARTKPRIPGLGESQDALSSTVMLPDGTLGTPVQAMNALVDAAGRFEGQRAANADAVRAAALAALEQPKLLDQRAALAALAAAEPELGSAPSALKALSGHAPALPNAGATSESAHTDSISQPNSQVNADGKAGGSQHPRHKSS